MKQILTTVSYNEKARKEIHEQLTPLIGDYFEIKSYCYQDYIRTKHAEDNLILITAPVVKDLIANNLDNNCKYFVAKRTINPQAIGLLFDIPKGTEVLIVNNLYENTLEVITELETIGINHLTYFPYIPGKPLEREYQYAITPDEAHLVPPGIPNIVNIGTRLISLMTIAQVLFYCRNGTLVDDYLYERYVRDLVNLSMKLSNQIKQNAMLQQQMKLVLSNFEDGIIVTETNQKITFHNTVAASILNEKQLIGRYLNEVHVNINQGEYSDAAFINIDDKVIHAENKHLTVDNQKTIHLITLKDLSNIKKIDEQYKRHAKYRGYTAKFTFDDIIHKSSTMAKTIALAKRFAEKDYTILITGESGTGKELFAQSIHNASARSKFPFIAINCAALSESLLESELFGYEEGAFTGARKGGKRGLFELADSGTIFLDELGDAPLSIQIKMLRVLQEREIMRISGNKIIPVDVRIIAATNKNLPGLVEQGLFRQDLYYRLNVLSLSVPPLRERKDDIELLLKHFLSKNNGPKPVIPKELIDMLCTYSWPGNIRQLQNIAEYITIAHDTGNNLTEDIRRLIGSSENKPVHPVPQKATQTLLFRDPKIRDELLEVLQLLLEAKNKHLLIGRYNLQKLLNARGRSLTLQQVKSRLDTLRNSNLITTLNGKGSVLTEKGEHYILSQKL
ncbi:sigma-54 interaction domain-containing protein [Sporomusa acidovorans]|uniref:Anaerobic nitric oxide reductase transcription regulator NorR n=1 Tax=Sporomusa acidovorans (strain ATCC 49682 / DSM 3132 / Mol) TaxID=1123286 RepID=A0ABZ3IX59_SPOA4|nr:sigma 54-interacting transcriptional regulator [Sporomusa acidovorans]OZC13044.1 transcriptional regulatory protein QseF [Sporomusa acidovorans DSM 3132]SDF51280.1 Transcriptional regulator containing PAS, AAA-type ATPase, and DNA-binding Fis domains [Sporomusa acidovorans]